MIIKNIIKLNIKQQVQEYLLMGLRLAEGINLINFENRFNLNLKLLFKETINKHKSFIELNNNIFLNENGMNILNKILVDFFCELDNKFDN